MHSKVYIGYRLALQLGPPFTYVPEHSLRMRIYDILFEHIAKSINCPRNSLVRSLSLSQDLQEQEAKYRIYYLRDNDSGSTFS